MLRWSKHRNRFVSAVQRSGRDVSTALSMTAYSDRLLSR